MHLNLSSLSNTVQKHNLRIARFFLMNNLFSSNVKVIIADDHFVIQQGLGIIISSFLKKCVLRYANSIESTFNLLHAEKVDLLILDVNMPGGNNFKMIKELRKIQPDLKILVFSAYEEITYGLRYLKEGVNGYLEKNSTEEEIEYAIKKVLIKGKFISPAIQDQLFEIYHPQTGFQCNLRKLTNRELEIAKLISSGEGTNRIAEYLGLQGSTISTHKKNIFEKLRISNVTELIEMFKLS